VTVIEIAALAFGSLFLLLIIGMPIAFAALVVGLLGLLSITDISNALYLVGVIPYSEVSIYTFTVLPMFMLMGYFFEIGGYAKDIFNTVRPWVARLPGGLAICTTLGSAAFGAACGSSVAAAAVLGRLCIPELEKYGYDSGLASGCVAAASNLATMIPPSALMVIYCMMTEASLGRLLIAGIIPGLIIALAFSLMIIIRCLTNPHLAPTTEEHFSWKTRFGALRSSWSIGVVFLIIMGGIYSGFFTPTEAGAAGAFATFLMALIPHKMSWVKLKESLLESAKATSMVFFIVICAIVFARFITIAQVPAEFASWITSLSVPNIIIILAICVVYVILGMFMEPASMMILTLPVFFPVVMALGYDPIWFGVIVVLNCEIGMITPPVGVNCFVVSGVAPHIPMQKIFKGILPFVIMNFIILLVLIVFPSISLFLPNAMLQ